MLGRTPGALDAAANRLLKPGDRPASRSYAWTVLIEEVNTSTIRTDWWAGRAADPFIPQSQSCSLMRYSTVRLGGPHCNNYGSRERFPRQSTCRPTLSKQTRHLAQRPINSAPR